MLERALEKKRAPARYWSARRHSPDARGGIKARGGMLLECAAAYCWSALRDDMGERDGGLMLERAAAECWSATWELGGIVIERDAGARCDRVLEREAA